MSILVQEIKDRMASRLDAEDSDRYLFDQDYKPAINGAQDWIVTALNPMFSSKKFSAEGLREITYTRIFQTNSFSRISFDQAALGHSIWTIIGVYPEPIVNAPFSILPPTDNSKSLYRNDLSFISSNESAQRLTAEEWNINNRNAFKAGNTILNNSLSFYGYRDFSNYASSSYTGASGTREIAIRPLVPIELVAVEYLKYPTQTNLITDSLDFPESMTEFIVEKALNFLSYKQGDRSTIYSVTEMESKRLLALIAS